MIFLELESIAVPKSLASGRSSSQDGVPARSCGDSTASIDVAGRTLASVVSAQKVVHLLKLRFYGREAPLDLRVFGGLKVSSREKPFGGVAGFARDLQEPFTGRRLRGLRRKIGKEFRGAYFNLNERRGRV